MTAPDDVADLLITGAAAILTCSPRGDDPLGRLDGGVVAVAGEKIAAIGSRAEVEAACDVRTAAIVDAAGGLVAPGFVDCHTHVVFGGSRAAEYGATVAGRLDSFRREHAIGIPATVAMTRSASSEALFESAADRLRRMFAHGTTTVESKSGYGLSTEHELRMLEVNRRLDAELPVDVVSTFLGAHAVPDGIDADRYTDLVVREMIPEVAARGAADFCDVYCDSGYFDVAQSRRILTAGAEAGLGAKLHADAYSAIGGSELAVELGAVSVDHLNHTPDATMRQLAERGVVGVIMPALDYAVAHPHPFDARAMLAAGMTLALATDICPGCWVESPQLVLAFAARSYGLSGSEALLAATCGGARALGLADSRGSLVAGKLADILLIDADSVDDLVYRIGVNAVRKVVKRGIVHTLRTGMTVALDGNSLQLADLIAVARAGAAVAIAPAAVERMREARAVVDEHVRRGDPVYGATTGVGALKRVPVLETDARSFNRRMLDSGMVGHGEPVAEERVRATMLRLANTLVKPAVGVRPELAQLVVEALNERRHPEMRLLGSVGQADLVPLAELADGLIEHAGFELAPGEGLALLDNNAFSTGIAALAMHDLTGLIDALEVAGALAMEAFGANPSVLHPILAESADPGLRLSADSLRGLLAGSSLWEPGVPRNLQDPLTFRTVAQVLGALRDAAAYTGARLAIELNAAQSNPLVVVDERRIVSVGCFDSQALASSLDFARIALAPALTASVERVQKLLSSTTSGLAPGLAEHPALADDGYFEFGVAAQAVAAEARLLAQPVSFDLVSTSQAEGIEDRTCMTPLAARRLADMVALGEHLAAIELTIAARGVDLRRSARLGRGTDYAHVAVRSALPAGAGRIPRTIESVRELIRGRALRRHEPA